MIFAQRSKPNSIDHTRIEILGGAQCTLISRGAGRVAQASEAQPRLVAISATSFGTVFRLSIEIW